MLYYNVALGARRVSLVYRQLSVLKKTMIDIKTVISTVQKRLERGSVGIGIELKTYKRDRGITIVKVTDDHLLIREDGFVKNEFEIPVEKLKKTLRSLLKKEFPRSKKVWLSEKRLSG
jgi:hypothetical protein